MDLLSKFSKERSYCKGINHSSFTQAVQDTQVIQGTQVVCNPMFPTIVDLFFNHFDVHYTLVDNKDKHMYIKQLIMNIATGIDEDKSNNYDNFNYLKCMNPTLIQQALQSMNTVACLLYLSDYYKVTTSVYLHQSETYVCTSIKDRNEFNILFENNKWSLVEVKPDYKEGEFKDLGIGLTLDVTTRDIYKKHLNPIGKYKAPELVDIANSMGLPLDNKGKKKVKKELYDDINYYQLNLG